MKDNHLDQHYTSSAFLLLCRAKYGLDKITLSRVSELTIKAIDEIVSGKQQLGREAYLKIITYLDKPIRVDYDGEVNNVQ